MGRETDNSLKFIVNYGAEFLTDEHRREYMSVNPIVEYLIKKLQTKGRSVEIISPSENAEKSGFLKSRVDTSPDGVRFFSGASLGTSGKVSKVLNRFVVMISLFLNIVKHTHKGETVLVYHSIANVPALLLAKKIRKLKYILFFGEIYYHVYPEYGKYARKKEISLINAADAYILSTEELRNYIGDKPYVVLNGIYQMEEKLPKFDFSKDGTINLLYSGKISRDMGAFSAIALAKVLDNRYTVRIIGSGEKKIVEELRAEVRLYQEEEHAARLIFDGMKHGTEFKRYVQSCQIGLSIREITGEFNKSSFPSKVCSYLCNGLKVVSTPIFTVMSSQLKDLIDFSDGMRPEEIAVAVEDAVNGNRNEKIDDKIKSLDAVFTDKLMRVIDMMG